MSPKLLAIWWLVTDCGNPDLAIPGTLTASDFLLADINLSLPNLENRRNCSFFIGEELVLPLVGDAL